jgi:MFS family permease
MNVRSIKFNIASFISSFGDMMQFTALNIFIYSLNKNITDIGFFYFIESFAFIVFSPLAGIIVDKYNRKYNLVFSYLISFFLVILLIKSKQLFVMYIIIFFLSILKVLSETTKNAFIGDIAEKEEYEKVQSVYSTLKSLSLILAPVLLSFLYNSLGIEFVYYINASTFLIASIILFSIKYTKSHTNKNSMYNHLKEGFTIIKNNKVIKIILLSLAITMFATSIYNSGLIGFNEEYLNYSESNFGLILSFSGIGGVIGGLIYSRFLKILSTEQLLTYSFFIKGVFIIGLLLKINLPLTLIFIGLINLTSTITIISARTIILKVSLPDNRGKIFGYMNSVLDISSILGLASLGIIAHNMNYVILYIALGIINISIFVYLYYKKLNTEDNFIVESN